LTYVQYPSKQNERQNTVSLGRSALQRLSKYILQPCNKLAGIPHDANIPTWRHCSSYSSCQEMRAYLSIPSSPKLKITQRFMSQLHISYHLSSQEGTRRDNDSGKYSQKLDNCSTLPAVEGQSPGGELPVRLSQVGETHEPLLTVENCCETNNMVCRSALMFWT
jgi:hypothetical protein